MSLATYWKLKIIWNKTQFQFWFRAYHLLFFRYKVFEKLWRFTDHNSFAFQAFDDRSNNACKSDVLKRVFGTRLFKFGIGYVSADHVGGCFAKEMKPHKVRKFKSHRSWTYQLISRDLFHDSHGITSEKNVCYVWWSLVQHSGENAAYKKTIEHAWNLTLKLFSNFNH